MILFFSPTILFFSHFFISVTTETILFFSLDATKERSKGRCSKRMNYHYRSHPLLAHQVNRIMIYQLLLAPKSRLIFFDMLMYSDSDLSNESHSSNHSNSSTNNNETSKSNPSRVFEDFCNVASEDDFLQDYTISRYPLRVFLILFISCLA